jgi:hypothetical protein
MRIKMDVRDAEERYIDGLTRRLGGEPQPILGLKERGARSRFRIYPGDPDVIRIDTTRKRPNAWRRFWYWLLLGWTWEEL